jgi:endonuclease/exonuclease/phosphatase family metal-dependent hydrolase
VTAGRRAPVPRPFLPAVLATVLLAAPPIANAARPAPDPLPTDTAGGTYRLLTWNVGHAVDADRQLVPDDVLAVIRQSRAHVAVLQDVPRGWPGAGGLDLAAWLARRLDAETHGTGDGLVLTSLPVVGAETAALPHGASATTVTVRLTGGEAARVTTAHLAGGDDGDGERIPPLLRAARAGRDPHAVLAGDLNAGPGSPELDALLDAGFHSAQTPAAGGILGAAEVGFEDLAVLDAAGSAHRPLAVTVWLD